MKVRPLYDRVLVKQLDEETVKGSGIIIPDSAKTKSQEGMIVAVGDGKLMDDGSKRELAVKNGAKILFAKYSGTEIKVDGTEYLLMREDDILGIIEE